MYVMKYTTTTACIVLACYFVNLRGEEIDCLDLGVMIKYWDKATTHVNFPHVALILSGTFKVEIGIKFFYQPLSLSLKTDRGLDIGVWFARLLKI